MHLPIVRAVCVAGAAVAWLAGLPVSAWAQSAPAPAASQQGPLNVFLDCNRCDDEHLRQDVGFIEYVRDRRLPICTCS